jgi:prepilin-type N-terminal cleavage/methylation domain-containing protein
MKHKTGFTLIEIAVVLTIVALLIGGLLIPLTTQIDIAKIQSTEKTLAQVKTALTHYAVSNNRLPCPANEDSTTKTNIGIEALANCNDAGYLPWVNLGVGQYDAWGNSLRYRVIQEYTDHVVESNGDLNTNVVNRETSFGFPNIPSIQDTQGNDIINAYDLVAIILSDGKNGETEQPALQQPFSLEPQAYLFKGLKGISELLLAPAFARTESQFPAFRQEIYTKCNAVSNCDDILSMVTISHLRAEMKQGPTTTLITTSKPESDDTIYTPTSTTN